MRRTPRTQNLTATFLPSHSCQIRKYSFLNPFVSCPPYRLSKEHQLITAAYVAANEGNFHLAAKHLDALKAMYKPEPGELEKWPLDVSTGQSYRISSDELVFLTTSPQMQLAIKDAARQVDGLLSRPSECLPLLGELDTTLGEIKKLPLVKHTSGEGFFVSDRLRVPSAPVRAFDDEKFDYTAIDIMSDKLSQHGIGKGRPPFFSGFVATENANAIVKGKEIPAYPVVT